MNVIQRYAQTTVIQMQAATIPLGALIATASLDLKEMGHIAPVGECTIVLRFSCT